MDTAEALRTLGVEQGTLSPSHAFELDSQGFVLLPNLLSSDRVRRMKARFDQLVSEEGENAGKEVHQEAGTARLSDLVNKDPMFDVCFTEPRVLAGVAHVLGTDFKLSSVNARAALPGAGLQSLHADWHEPVEPGEYQVCNSIWLLDDFIAENGATRVIPGSHRSRLRPTDVLADPAADHPEQRLLLAPAGSVVIFNSHTWHGGTLNRTAFPRRAAHAYFCRRQHSAQLDQQRYLRPETFARLSAAARCVLGVREEPAFEQSA
jgi:ectoine hydroxylase-related dioxygenase (phytanoyl-CoA dioxygenase family)